MHLCACIKGGILPGCHFDCNSRNLGLVEAIPYDFFSSTPDRLKSWLILNREKKSEAMGVWTGGIVWVVGLYFVFAV